MLNLGDKLVEAQVASAERPEKATFQDGRLATKEAFNFCKALCARRKIDPPSYMAFKWHVQHGEHLEGELVPNPFGDIPQRIYAIHPDEVKKFVLQLEKDGDSLRIIEQRQGNVLRRTRRPRGESSTPTAPKTEPPKPTVPEPTKPIRVLSRTQAYEYLLRKAQGDCTLTNTTFGHYLTYEVIDSTMEGHRRYVGTDSIDVFLDLCPTGVYADAMVYQIGLTLKAGELSMGEAFEYYSSVDPEPITKGTFRSLVATGIIQAIREANNPKARTVGFRKQEMDSFLALRHRIAHRQGKEPEKTVVSSKAPPKASPKPTRPPVTSASTTKPRRSKKTHRGPVTITKAYEYYCEKASEMGFSPLTKSWFSSCVYQNKNFRSNVVEDKRPTNPQGKLYLVDLDSIDEYILINRDEMPKPKVQAYPIDIAYHKFRDLMPRGLSLVQFRKLVKEELIASVTKDGVGNIRSDAIESYFEGVAEIDSQRVVGTGGAYDYYCSRASDPVAKPHFSRFITTGALEGAYQNEEGLWQVRLGAIDDFLVTYPSGRMRVNKNSRVALEKPTSPKRPKPTRKKAAPPAAPAPPVATPGSKGNVSVSMSAYSNPLELAKALETLTDQGFVVEVKP